MVVEPIYGSVSWVVEPIYGSVPWVVEPIHGSGSLVVEPIHGSGPRFLEPIHGTGSGNHSCHGVACTGLVNQTRPLIMGVCCLLDEDRLPDPPHNI